MADKILIVGNAGSGKTTLAKKIQQQTKAAILDLDTITWDRQELQRRRSFNESIKDLENFISLNSHSWIIEGCYGEFIEHCLQYSPTLIFLDPGEEICRANCVNREWEQHKYPSKSEQDKFLPFLLSWVSEYYRREGPMSHSFHQKIFNEYSGEKSRIA